jgi:hypothetical protein
MIVSGRLPDRRGGGEEPFAARRRPPRPAGRTRSFRAADIPGNPA